MRLSETIPWESFRPLLEKGYIQERKSNAGRKRIDPVILFKMLVLQQLFNLSDEELELQVNDRRSFLDCVRLGRTSPDGGRSCAAAQAPAGLWTVRKGYQILRSLVPPL